MTMPLYIPIYIRGMEKTKQKREKRKENIMKYKKTINLQETRISREKQSQLREINGLTIDYFTHDITGMKHIEMITDDRKIMLKVNRILAE